VSPTLAWIVSKEDIQAIYNAHFEGDVITIWWEGRGKLRILVKSGRMQIKRIPSLSKQEECDYLHE